MERKRYERLDETMFHTVLPNGLPIYVDEKPEYGKQFAFFATHYGGMTETPFRFWRLMAWTPTLLRPLR